MGTAADPAQVPEVAALRAAQARLQLLAPIDVLVPYAEQISEHLTSQPLEPRVQRDFERLLALIKAHALLCERQRQRDAHGRLLAAVEDYAAVYALVAPVFASAAGEGASKNVLETVAGVAQLLGGREEGATVSVSELAHHLGLSKDATSKRVGRALAGGWLVNEEDRRGRPARLRLGEPLPPEVGLPTPDQLAKSLSGSEVGDDELTAALEGVV